MSKGAVGAYLSRVRAAGLSWPLPSELDDDDALELLLFPGQVGSRVPERPVPDWGAVDRELRRKGVTRALLWEEYRAAHPEGYGYAWFCEHFEAWKGRVRPTMRQTHVGGDKVFIDFSGDGIEIVDPLTGEVTEARLFVAAMGASSYTYAEARPAETLEDWIGAQVNLFAFLGGVPRMVVPDNPRAVIVAPDRYEPGLNRTMAAMAEHYGVAVLPARSRKPRDKAKVEAAVLVAQRWIIARLRHRRFFSIEELAAAIRPLVDEINTRIMRGYSVLFTPATTLVAQLAKAHGEGRLEEKLTHYAKPKLLIVDELGYLPFEPDAAHLFFQLVSRRYERGAMLVTSNRAVGEWGSVFGDPVVATAILDRLLHHSHVITIRGDSYRLREKRRSGLLQKAAATLQPATA